MISSKPLETVVPQKTPGTFLGFPRCTDISQIDADIAILGIPYGDPYGIEGVTNDQSNAPAAIRQASYRLTLGLDYWDFDLGGTLLDERPVRVVEITPSRDLNEITCITAGQLILNFIGLTARNLPGANDS